MKLYINALSPNSRKVIALADHLSSSVDITTVDLSDGSSKKPEFLAVNPNGKIPALSDGDFNLWESNAIMAYMASKSDTTMWPDSNARYDIIRWMSWELAHWGRWISTYGFETFLKGMFGMGEADPAVVEESGKFIQRFAKVLDDHLATNDFLVDGHLTIADFAVGSHLTYRIPAKLPLDDFKNITAWEARLDAIPAWKNSAPKN